MGAEHSGAYGFRLVLPDHEPALPDLISLDERDPSVKLDWRHAACLVTEARIEPDFVSLREERNSLLEVRRDPATITMELPEAATPETLVHPLLTPPISILARWRGDLTLHAGGFFAEDRAWAVVGAREAGKSTTLATLAERGVPLLADDLLVLDEGVVRAGPACIDLRADVAERTPGARFLGEVGKRPRYRLTATAGPARAELGGFFLLDWSDEDEVSVAAVPAGEALGIVYEQEYIGLLGAADPNKIFDLLEVPMWRVRRPRDWDRRDAAIDRMLEITAR